MRVIANGISRGTQQGCIVDGERLSQHAFEYALTMHEDDHWSVGRLTITESEYQTSASKLLHRSIIWH